MNLYSSENQDELAALKLQLNKLKEIHNILDVFKDIDSGQLTVLREMLKNRALESAEHVNLVTLGVE